MIAHLTARASPSHLTPATVPRRGPITHGLPNSGAGPAWATSQQICDIFSGTRRKGRKAIMARFTVRAVSGNRRRYRRLISSPCSPTSAALKRFILNIDTCQGRTPFRAFHADWRATIRNGMIAGPGAEPPCFRKERPPVVLLLPFHVPRVRSFRLGPALSDDL
jgi:hypothetical protein